VHSDPVVTNTSIFISTNEIQNGDILVLANPGTPGNMAVKTETEIVNQAAMYRKRLVTHTYIHTHIS